MCISKARVSARRGCANKGRVSLQMLTIAYASLCGRRLPSIPPALQPTTWLGKWHTCFVSSRIQLPCEFLSLPLVKYAEVEGFEKR